MHYLSLALVGALFAPQAVFAQPEAADLLVMFQEILAALIPAIVGLALVVFLFGLIRYVVASTPEARKEAWSIIIYGVVVLFVMVSIWGLVNILIETFQLDLDPPPTPKL